MCTIPAMRIAYETIEKCIGVSALLVFRPLLPGAVLAQRYKRYSRGHRVRLFRVRHSILALAGRTDTAPACGADVFRPGRYAMFFMMMVGALLPSRFADHGPGFWILEALILPTGIAMFTVPFLFLRFANRVDGRRYSHIVECHPLLARLVWEPELGPKPLGGIYRRRCERWFCFLRAL